MTFSAPCLMHFENQLMALKSIKVIELAGLAPVPFCGMVLADFGARVIRIDRPKAPSMDTLSRGKQSVSVNLKKKEGLEVLRKLCQTADVLIEPFRPGVMEKLGLGPDVLTSANPRLIYARLTGYGQSGCMSHKAGHDINYIAMAGVLSKFGRWKERPNPPVNVVADFGGGGLMCALGIVMALYERSVSGKGQVIDANMVEGSAYLASFIDSNRDTIFAGERGRNLLDGGAAFYDTYETKDGQYMAAGSLESKFYEDLLKGLGLEQSGISQTDDQEQQRELFRKIFLTKTRDEWVEVFQDLDACVTPVLSTDEAAQHPHNKSKESFLQGPNALLQAGPSPRLSRTPGIREQRHLPEPGQHTIDVLKEYGFSDTELSALIKSGALFQASNL
uniref:Alpha-methylacyl-CoA racemase n=2 Tax=Arion vulgaris TaxID=1028688 RepID=A0A0B6ZF29_9EUPU